MGFTNGDIHRVFMMFQECLIANCSLPDKLDENLSNRDHGSNLNNGFRELFITSPDFKDGNTFTQFKSLSFLFTYKIKGATSPTYSYVFNKTSEHTKNTGVLNREMSGGILKITAESVKFVGNCELNDKTILNCANAAGKNFEESKNGNTIRLVKRIGVNCKLVRDKMVDVAANKGKARHNAAYSVGVIDPGAYPLFLSFDTLCKYVLKRGRTR